MYDFIIIGSGYGGLSSAALLAHYGFSVLTLEAHSAIGGCASFFKRKNFVFDVGATTISGVLKHQPLGKLFSKLNIVPKLKKLDPGLIVKTLNKNISRFSEKSKWIEECKNIFGDGNFKGFWDEIYSLENSSWELIENNHRLPPRNFSDLVSLAKPQNLQYISLVPGLVRPLESLLKKYDLYEKKDFVAFIDEQLLISTQNISNMAPYLTSAIGLAYPSETYYPYGGIYKPLELVLNSYLSTNNELKLKNKVVSIEKILDYYEVKTINNKIYKTKGIISNIPIWNMANITSGEIKSYFESHSNNFQDSWGAITLYFGVESIDKLETAYYQIHTKEIIPYCSSTSFFVSFSMEDDFEKAPQGYKSVTISTHTDIKKWDNLTKEEYSKQKNIVENYLLEYFDKSFPQLADNKKFFVMTGTPSTFEFFTHRYKGFVGGIPHSIKKNILQIPSNTTPFKNFYMVGDTVFPGQGIPAVVQGSLNVTDRIIRSSF